jgi:Protein of unknown function (DUF3828)
MRAIALVVAFVLVLAAGSAHAETAGDPARAIGDVYQAYQAAQANHDVPKLRGVYSRRLKRLLDADHPKGEIGRLDFDFFVDGQDFEITNLHITPVSQSAAKAQVRAAFDNLGRASDLLFDMVHEGGHWVVDDVRSTSPKRRWTLSKILKGAPDAFPDMKK